LNSGRLLISENLGPETIVTRTTTGGIIIIKTIGLLIFREVRITTELWNLFPDLNQSHTRVISFKLLNYNFPLINQMRNSTAHPGSSRKDQVHQSLLLQAQSQDTEMIRRNRDKRERINTMRMMTMALTMMKMNQGHHAATQTTQDISSTK
jgi:hypothetical protein